MWISLATKITSRFLFCPWRDEGFLITPQHGTESCRESVMYKILFAIFVPGPIVLGIRVITKRLWRTRLYSTASYFCSLCLRLQNRNYSVNIAVLFCTY